MAEKKYLTKIAFSSKVVEHMPHHPKVKGLSLTAADGNDVDI